MTVKVSRPNHKELRLGVLGCGFMGKCHTNAYKKIPYIYSEAGLVLRLLVLCDKQEEKVREEAARYGYEEYATDSREMAADPRIDVVDNLRARPGPSRSVHCRLGAWQARDLREADGRLGRRRAADARCLRVPRGGNPCVPSTTASCPPCAWPRT